jgi:hypothetical protein
VSGEALKLSVNGACPTCTLAVCGELLPPVPVATAEYVVVWVGESFTFPEACELVVTVREVESEVAVMVTDVAFVVCQVNVTLCPAVIAFVLAEKINVGVAEVLGSGAGDPPPQLIKTVASVNGKKVRTCRARERVRIATSEVRASFGAGLGCGRFIKGCMSTRGERNGNALKRRDEAFHSPLMGQKGGKQRKSACTA